MSTAQAFVISKKMLLDGFLIDIDHLQLKLLPACFPEKFAAVQREHHRPPSLLAGDDSNFDGRVFRVQELLKQQGRPKLRTIETAALVSNRHLLTCRHVVTDRGRLLKLCVAGLNVIKVRLGKQDLALLEVESKFRGIFDEPAKL